MIGPAWRAPDWQEHIAFCREQAEVILTRAGTTPGLEMRYGLLRLAESWQALAGELERLKREHPEIIAADTARIRSSKPSEH